MKIDTMRRIDRWVGIPLCAVTSGILRVWWRIWPRPHRPVRHVLFIELSEMGSTILAQPAMRKARERFNAVLFFVIFERNAGSLEFIGTPPRSRVFTIRDDTIWHFAWDTLKFLVWTRRNEIDTVLDLELFSRYTGLLTGLSGGNRRVGFYRFYNEGLYRGEMLTHRVAYNPHIHIAKNFIAQINALLSSEPTTPYSKTLVEDAELAFSLERPAAEARNAMAERIRALVADFEPSRFRLVLVNPGGNEFIPLRRWMPERFADLIRRIATTYEDVLVLITGAPNERDHAAAIAASSAHARCVSFAGRSTLAELPALYSLASAMIASDSGPAHFAAACGVPTIALFGPETPTLYQPLGNAHVMYAGLACSPCVSAQNHRRTPCTDNVCMQAITVDQVFTAVAEVLS